MDNNLAFSRTSPPPLILPRRVSFHSNTRSTNHPKMRQYHIPSSPPASPESQGISGNNNLAHYYYYPSGSSGADLSSSYTDPSMTGLSDLGQSRIVVSVPTLSTYSSSASTSFGGNRSGMIRRHSVANGSPWSAIPPKHALHMPVMKVDPTVWRNEHHQQQIYRLMHEGRKEEVMRRRKIKSVMDTSEEGDDDNEMDDVVLDIDLGGFKAAENRAKEEARQQVLQEWTQQIERQQRQKEVEENFRRRLNSWPKQLETLRVHFLDPNQVLHPNNGQEEQQMQQSLQQIPSQLPVPGQQLGRTMMMTTGPLSNPSAWSASPAFMITNSMGSVVDTRRPAFAAYRG
ncbi:hypothetical protein EMPS_01821 [Entomortierella parvispora]|uniref:Uncharacterized protein n=1 Tax=Entomortierella parvispora TaxID=205924 RepID=A0A9P3LTB7_9FUNG|nr:hypothetical protein EMPS_01821 [Entomortierella parvispora]